MAGIELVIRSQGGPGAPASMTLNGVEIAPGRYGRGLNVATIDQSIGAVRSFEVYDTWESSARADDFARAVEALPIGRLVLVAVADDASRHLTDRARNACRLLGSARIASLGSHDAWALVGQRGAAPGTRAEQLADGEGPVTLTSAFELQAPALSGFALCAASAGFDHGDWAALTIEGASVPMPGGYGRGMNVAVIDETSATVLSTHVFDTYASTAASEALAALIENLPEGRVVMVAVKDEATSHLTERAKAALELLGSARIRELTYRGSWSLVGRQYAPRGTVAECLAGTAPARACWWMTPWQPPADWFTISLVSAGARLGDATAVHVDSVAVLGGATAERGFHLAVVSPASGIVSARGSFDVAGDGRQADALARFVDDAPVGAIVAVALHGDGARNLNDNARRALASLGSALIGNLTPGASYALLGVKGSAPGVVPELLSATEAVAVCLRFVVPRGAQLPLHEVQAFSAGMDAGDAAAIVLDGRYMEMPGGYGRGLNVALIDRDGSVQHAECFDTYQEAYESHRFARLVAGAPAGQIVAIAVKDEASWHLDEPARQACRSIGSIEVDRLTYRDSWAIVGVKGAAPGTAAEIRSHARPAFAKGRLLDRLEEAGRGVWLGVGSAGGAVGNDAWLLCDGRRLEVSGRGLQVAIFDETSGELLLARAYDTHDSSAQADELAAAIEALPAGRVVAVAVKDEAADKLTPRARAALGTLGSATAQRLAHRESWAMVGVKGTAPGSALETASAGMPVAVQGWSGYFATDAAAAELAGVPFALMLAVAIAVVGTLLIVVVVSALLPSPAAHPPPTPRVRRRGVFIGVDYTNIYGLDLRGRASELVGTLRRAWCNVNLPDGFAEDAAMLITEQGGAGRTPSRTNVLAALRWLVTGAQPGDVLYFHYLGHGSVDTLRTPPEELLLTLTADLRARDGLREQDIKAAIAALPTTVNLTLAFHCCFSGSLIDASDSGRGIAFGSTTDDRPTRLPAYGPNFTDGMRVCGLDAFSYNPIEQRTYAQALAYLRGPTHADTAQLIGNPSLYDFETLKFLQPLPRADEPTSHP